MYTAGNICPVCDKGLSARPDPLTPVDELPDAWRKVLWRELALKFSIEAQPRPDVTKLLDLGYRVASGDLEGDGHQFIGDLFLAWKGKK